MTEESKARMAYWQIVLAFALQLIYLTHFLSTIRADLLHLKAVVKVIELEQKARTPSVYAVQQLGQRVVTLERKVEELRK